jgi:hypothetical protein
MDHAGGGCWETAGEGTELRVGEGVGSEQVGHYIEPDWRCKGCIVL